MNDIEVLEEFKKNGYHMLLMKCGDRHTTNLKLEMAIENLLKERQSDKDRIKDLEEINEAHKKENGELRKELESVKEIYYTQKEMEDVMVRYRKLVENSIPKSLIKEKIEELKKQYKDYEKRWEEAGMDKAHPFYKYLIRIEAEIDILEELLKGE